LAPASVQEAIDLTVLAFDLAEKYRTLVVVIADGNIGQMMEPAELPPMRPINKTIPEWAVQGAEGRERRVLSSIYIKPEDEEVVNIRLVERWRVIEAQEIHYKEYYLDDAEIIIVGYGTAGRVALTAVRAAREEGVPVGLFRPITVSPYPYNRITQLIPQAKSFLVVEMSAGQMLEDVKKAVAGRVPIDFYGRMGGIVPFPDEILGEIKRVASDPIGLDDDPKEGWLKRLKMVVGQ